jgi:hypothetical protein
MLIRPMIPRHAGIMIPTILSSTSLGKNIVIHRPTTISSSKKHPRKTLSLKLRPPRQLQPSLSIGTSVIPSIPVSIHHPAQSLHMMAILMSKQREIHPRMSPVLLSLQPSERHVQRVILTAVERRHHSPRSSATRTGPLGPLRKHDVRRKERQPLILQHRLPSRVQTRNRTLEERGSPSRTGLPPSKVARNRRRTNVPSEQRIVPSGVNRLRPSRRRLRRRIGGGVLGGSSGGSRLRSSSRIRRVSRRVAGGVTGISDTVGLVASRHERDHHNSTDQHRDDDGRKQRPSIRLPPGLQPMPRILQPRRRSRPRRVPTELRRRKTRPGRRKTRRKPRRHARTGWQAVRPRRRVLSVPRRRPWRQWPSLWRRQRPHGSPRALWRLRHPRLPLVVSDSG